MVMVIKMIEELILENEHLFKDISELQQTSCTSSTISDMHDELREYVEGNWENGAEWFSTHVDPF